MHIWTSDAWTRECTRYVLFPPGAFGWGGPFAVTCKAKFKASRHHSLQSASRLVFTKVSRPQVRRGTDIQVNVAEDLVKDVIRRLEPWSRMILGTCGR